MDVYSGRVVERIAGPVGIELTTRNRRGTLNVEGLSRGEVNAMKASGEVVIMLLFFAIFATSWLNWMFSSVVAKTAYAAVPMIFSVLVGATTWWLEINKDREADERCMKYETPGGQEINNFDCDLYTNNLQIVFYALAIIGATASLLSPLISTVPDPVLLNIHLWTVVQFVAISLFVPVLPHFFNSFVIISATVAAIVFCLCAISAVLVGILALGGCAGCIILLAIEGLLAIEMTADPAASILSHAKEVLNKSSVIDW